MVNARNKGAAFERAIVKKINDYLESTGSDQKVKRNLDQYQKKGLADIYWGRLAIECKAYKGNGNHFMQERWWKQACDAAGDLFIPVLIYKYNGTKPKVVMPAHVMIKDLPKKNEAVMIGYLSDICKKIDVILNNVHHV